MAHLHEQKSKGWIHVVKDELICHLPYAIFSVVLALISINLFNHISWKEENHVVAHHLFHGFHFLHLIFAGTGVVLAFRKYSDKVGWAIVIGLFVPTVFCTLSDSILPYYGGRLLDLTMHFHWCFKDHLGTVLPFLGLGLVNGLVMSRHSLNKRLMYATSSHFLHILISSMAAMFYLVSFGLTNIWDSIGFVFLFLIIAVLIPCTLSDVVIPIFFATVPRTKKAVMKEEMDCHSCSQTGKRDEGN